VKQGAAVRGLPRPRRQPEKNQREPEITSGRAGAGKSGDFHLLTQQTKSHQNLPISEIINDTGI
jgi:hypothetical protein